MKIITKIWNLIFIKEALIWGQLLSTNSVYRLHDCVFVFIIIIIFIIAFVLLIVFVVILVIKEGLRDKVVVECVEYVVRVDVGHCFVICRVSRVVFFRVEII